MSNFITKCEFLENGVRCGFARQTGIIPVEGINPQILKEGDNDDLIDREVISQFNLLPVGSLIVDCKIALQSGKRNWIRIGRCDPRSN